MYAIILSGGKQHRVAVGDVVRLDLMQLDLGAPVTFDEVLLVQGADGTSKVGAPRVSGCKVTATVMQHGRGDKISVIKFKRRKHHMKHQGHRQWYTSVKIEEIVGA